MTNPFKSLNKKEWLLWGISLTLVIASNIVSGSAGILTVCSTAVGVTALIFVAKGSVWGQIFTILFAVLYSITSYSFRYYGEIITYLGMTAPIAAMSAAAWLRHPYKEGTDEVAIAPLTPRRIAAMSSLAAAVTVLFYFILKYLGTANLITSTVSITTSFLASYLMLYRSPYYAAAYSANDIVLIILWVSASVQDHAYLPMAVCFAVFLANDIYGFISWKKRMIRQQG